MLKRRYLNRWKIKYCDFMNSRLKIAIKINTIAIADVIARNRTFGINSSKSSSLCPIMLSGRKKNGPKNATVNISAINAAFFLVNETVGIALPIFVNKGAIKTITFFAASASIENISFITVENRVVIGFVAFVSLAAAFLKNVIASPCTSKCEITRFYHNI
jgi:hypothetical protein